VWLALARSAEAYDVRDLEQLLTDSFNFVDWLLPEMRSAHAIDSLNAYNRVPPSQEERAALAKDHAALDEIERRRKQLGQHP
jgi:hypothetical protein